MNHILISRDCAQAQGLKRYFTGEPCRNGHIAARRVSNTKCVECEMRSNKLFRQTHPVDRERRAKDSAQWRKRNPDRAKANVTRWCAENPEKRKSHRASWDARNLGYRRANTAKWRAALRRATPPWLTEEHKREIELIYASRPEGYHVDHIYPLIGKNSCGLHVPWNLQHLPAKANSSKGNSIT